MGRELLLSQEDVARFAEASGDRNPLHVDPAFARATPYGRPIAHGALVAIAALGAVEPAALRRLGTLQLQFKHPVVPGVRHTVDVADLGGGRTRVVVSGGGRPAATFTLTEDADSPPLPVPRTNQVPLPVAPPRRHTIDELAAGGLVFRQPYACDLDSLAALAADLDSPNLPPALAAWLAAASYTIGMVVPGVDAIFAGARLSRSAAPGGGELSGEVTAADDRTGLVTVDAELALDGASATLALTAFLRPPLPPPNRDAIASHLRPSAALRDRHVLVVGASRGLGAALAAALATQDATVWVGFDQSLAHAEALREEHGADRIRLLRFDAGDAPAAQAALSELAREASQLDGVVLCAAPPLYEAGLASETAAAAADFVRDSVALAIVPLAASLPLLAEDGFVAVLSSPVVEEPPEQWAHYAMAKAAVEAAAAYCRRSFTGRVLVARPPKLWTDSTNTPLGRIGATPREQVAAVIARWAATGDRRELLTPEDFAAPPSADGSPR